MSNSTTTTSTNDTTITSVGKDGKKKKKVRLVSVKPYTKVVNGKTIQISGYSYKRKT